ncbi:MAG: MGMT family protein [Thermoprotei archaeon]
MIIWEPDKGVIRRASYDDIREVVYALIQLIPPGRVTSYGDIAKILGVSPRLVGRALRDNDKPIVIPCHRVVGSNGELRGYSLGGTGFKKKLLELEGVGFRGNRVMKEYFISLVDMLGR